MTVVTGMTRREDPHRPRERNCADRWRSDLLASVSKDEHVQPHGSRRRKRVSSPRGAGLARDDLDLAVDTVDDVERALEHLALVLGDGAIFAFGQYDAGKSADRFLDDVAARRDHGPCGVGQRLAALVADQL